MPTKIAYSKRTRPTLQICQPAQLPSQCLCQVGSKAEYQRSGSILIVLLVVLMIAGMLTYQSIRTLLMVRKSHGHQARVAQARELLDLARQLEQSPSQRNLIQPGQYTIVLPLGEQFGKLELVYANQAEQGGQQKSSAKTMWIAKTPVDAQGNEVTGQSTVVVSSER